MTATRGRGSRKRPANPPAPTFPVQPANVQPPILNARKVSQAVASQAPARTTTTLDPSATGTLPPHLRKREFARAARELSGDTGENSGGSQNRHTTGDRNASKFVSEIDQPNEDTQNLQEEEPQTRHAYGDFYGPTRSAETNTTAEEDKEGKNVLEAPLIINAAGPMSMEHLKSLRDRPNQPNVMRMLSEEALPSRIDRANSIVSGLQPREWTSRFEPVVLARERFETEEATGPRDVLDNLSSK